MRKVERGRPRLDLIDNNPYAGYSSLTGFLDPFGFCRHGTGSLWKTGGDRQEQSLSGINGPWGSGPVAEYSLVCMSREPVMVTK